MTETAPPLVACYRLETPELPPQRGQLYDYVGASNGVFIRASRPGLQVLFPVAPSDIRGNFVVQRGLYPLDTRINLAYPPVPFPFVAALFEMARRNRDAAGDPLEKLFYLHGADAPAPWRIFVPAQQQTGYSVQALDTGRAYTQAIIEIHSHHRLACFFSAADDADEMGFRIYGVMGHIYTVPQIRLRVGVYGTWFPIPTTGIMVVPPHIRDAVADDAELAARVEEDDEATIDDA